MYEIFERLLSQKGVRVIDVSRDTGISNSMFTDWKKGRYTPKTDKLEKIAAYFGVSVDYLLTGKERTLRNDEQEVLARFRLLNDAGRDEFFRYLDYLTCQDRYKKDTSEKVG